MTTHLTSPELGDRRHSDVDRGPWASLRRALGRRPREQDDPLDPVEAVVPRAEVTETDDAYLVNLQVPGLARRDIAVEQAGRHLTVTCERTDRERLGLLRRRTRAVGVLRYDLVLPSEVREDGVDATVADGVLTIRVPRRDLSQPRRVPIL